MLKYRFTSYNIIDFNAEKGSENVLRKRGA